MKIIIVIPCYNEEKILEKNIKEVLEAIKNLPQDKIVLRILKSEVGEINETDAKLAEMS